MAKSFVLCRGRDDLSRLICACESKPEFDKNVLGRDGWNHAAALRTALEDMIAGKKYSAPFYWARFVVIGDWR